MAHFVLGDKSCFTGTDYSFILRLQTPANVTLHTNGLAARSSGEGEREGDGETDGKEGKERSAMNKRWTKNSEWRGERRGGVADRRGVTARNGYKSERREKIGLFRAWLRLESK